MNRKTRFMASSAIFNSAMGRMSPTERRAGRYLRAPDGHGGGDGGADGGSGGGGGDQGGIDIPDVLDSLDSLPAKLQAFYVKDDTTGKFKLDDVGSLRSAVGNIKNENKTLKGQMSQLAALRDLGLTADEIKQMKADSDAAAEAKAREAGDFDSLKQQMIDNFNTKTEEFKGRETKLVGTIEKLLVDDAARAVLADPEIEGSPVLLLPLIRDRVKVTETDDGFELQVLQAKGGAPMLNAQNEPATLKDLFLEMKGKSEYAGAFKGLGQSGGGAPGGSGGNGGGAPASKKRSEMNNAQKSEFIRANGLEAYNRLPA